MKVVKNRYLQYNDEYIPTMDVSSSSLCSYRLTYSVCSKCLPWFLSRAPIMSVDVWMTRYHCFIHLAHTGVNLSQ